jgi:hypothetical protein
VNWVIARISIRGGGLHQKSMLLRYIIKKVCILLLNIIEKVHIWFVTLVNFLHCTLFCRLHTCSLLTLNCILILNFSELWSRSEYFFKKGCKIHNFCATTKFFLHIFGVAQNFWLNGEGFMAQKGCAGRPLPPGYGPGGEGPPLVLVTNNLTPYIT